MSGGEIDVGADRLPTLLADSPFLQVFRGAICVDARSGEPGTLDAFSRSVPAHRADILNNALAGVQSVVNASRAALEAALTSPKLPARLKQTLLQLLGTMADKLDGALTGIETFDRLEFPGHDPRFVCTPDGVITRINPATIEMFRNAYTHTAEGTGELTDSTSELVFRVPEGATIGQIFHHIGIDELGQFQIEEALKQKGEFTLDDAQAHGLLGIIRHREKGLMFYRPRAVQLDDGAYVLELDQTTPHDSIYNGLAKILQANPHAAPILAREIAGLERGDTRVHILRVSSGLVRIMHLLNEFHIQHAGGPRFTSEQFEAAQLGGYLHDVGKITVPQNVLLKNGAFTVPEWVMVTGHVWQGAYFSDMMRTAELQGTASESEKIRIHARYEIIDAIIGGHHLRYDGVIDRPKSGHDGFIDRAYKGGYGQEAHELRGDEIPIYSMLTALVDVYDALRSSRVYKAGKTREEALAIMRRDRGAQFNPVLLDFFMQHVEEIMPDSWYMQTDESMSIAAIGAAGMGDGPAALTKK